MTKILSFCATGDYAAFRDPSITSNQTVYHIPSKTAVVGILGAILGIKRSNRLDEIYSADFLNFFSKIKIGLEVKNNPQKIVYFTNHRSLKESKTKPVKKEILVQPKYTVYIQSSSISILDNIQNAITNNKFCFSPYLGHAYCPAKINNSLIFDGKKIEDVAGEVTRCVVLDETETYNENFNINLNMVKTSGMLIVERHLHHFIKDEKLHRRVLKHWIPLESTECEIEEIQKNKLSEFYKINGNNEVICLY